MAMETKVYKLIDIVAPDVPPAAAVALGQAIMKTVAVDDWDRVGGNSSIAAFAPVHDKTWRLIVTADSSVQTTIQQLITDLST